MKRGITKHKHQYKPCVFEKRYVVFDINNGYVHNIDTSIGTYCTCCGKIGVIQSDAWLNWSYRFSERRHDTKWTEEAMTQLDKRTRTLPTFNLTEYSTNFVLREEFEELHMR